MKEGCCLCFRPGYYRGFIEGWAPGKLTGCEDEFACLVRSSTNRLEEQFSYEEVYFKQFCSTVEPGAFQLKSPLLLIKDFHNNGFGPVAKYFEMNFFLRKNFVDLVKPGKAK